MKEEKRMAKLLFTTSQQIVQSNNAAFRLTAGSQVTPFVPREFVETGICDPTA